MTTMRVNVVGGSADQREALAHLIQDYLYHQRDLKCRNVDASEQLDVFYPERLAQQKLSGVQIDVCMPS